MHWLQSSEVALYRAFQITTGEVKTLFTTVKLTTNLIDGNTPFAKDEEVARTRVQEMCAR